MARWRTYNFWCQHCGHRDDAVLFDLDTEDPNVYNCTECGELSERTFGAPTVLNNSYAMGQRRNDPAFQNAREIANLQVEQVNTDDRKEKEAIEKEISARKKPITKGGG